MDWKQTDRSKEDSKLSTPCALWPVDLKLTHTDCSPGNTFVHFQGQYATICELDYNILHVEIQNVSKTAVSVDVGDFCLVEDFQSSLWYRGRVQNKSEDLFDVFLLDQGNILSVGPEHLATISDSLLMLTPKIVCGFFANVLPVQQCWDQPSEAYFSSLIGRPVKGYIHGLLPYKVLILEVPEINKDLLRLSLGRHVDTDTFLLLVELEMEVPIQQGCESVPDLLIEKQIAQKISFKSSGLCGYENVLSLGGAKLDVGQKERVRIAAAINPGLFYCQTSSAAKDLEEMSESLALVCESRNGDITDKPGENMGLLCAIKGKDERWHRGFVQCLPVNSQVRVVFVDYGYCESVNVEKIIPLSDFLQRPVMSFPCALSCLGDKDKTTVNQQLVLLRKGLLGKELVITVDDLNKEKDVCSVTLSNVVECAPIRTVQSKEVDTMASSGILINAQHYSPHEAKTMGISKNSVACEHLKDGSVFEGYVEYVLSPHDFWMRTAESNDRFEAMMNKLTDQFSRLQLNEEILQDPVPGELCCAMYEKDGYYYRALVVDILEYGAEVFFIDFGNTEKVPSMLIKKIPNELTVEPEFALHCSLAHVLPLEEVWTAVVTDFFRKATSNKAIQVHVIYRRSDVYVVELYKEEFGKTESISTLLTNANMAAYWTFSAMKTPGTPAEENNKTGKTFARRQFAEKSCESMSQKRPGELTSQEIATDKRVHTETQECRDVEIFQGQRFKPGALISVNCSHVSSPSDFWCQDKKNKNDLDRLMERLQKFYQTNTSELKPQSLCCAVRFHLDKKWYRGCILEETNLNVKIILVDYGKVVHEKLQNLQGLNPEFLELEWQAFRCSLYNFIYPVGGDMWSDEASTLLKDFTSGNSRNLKCTIYSQLFVANKGLFNMIDLYTPLQRASEHLIEKGVAKERQCPYQLLPSVYPCSFVYSSFDITNGTEELVFPTHVVSPWEIYAQLDRNTEIIKQLKDRAMKESEELVSQMHTGKTGSVCLAKYSEDGKWYRSFVWPAQSSLHVNVFFVDYGTKQVAEKRNVLSIPIKAVDLLLTPMQALRCSLLGVPEEEHLPEVNTWLEKTTLNKGVQAKFVATNSSGHFICDLFVGDIHINEKVREMFAIHGQKGQSDRKPTISDRCDNVVNVSSVGNKFKTKGRHHVESVVKSQRTPDLSKVVHGNGQSCQKKSSKLKSPQTSCNLNGGWEKNGQAKAKNSLTLRKQPQKEKNAISSTSNIQPCKVFPKVSDLPAIKIAPGFRSVGFISHCNSADSFFIQLEKDEQNILKMREELNSSPYTKGVTSNVKAGDLVAARYDKDLALYRAAIISVASSGYLTIEFVDYGNTATVDKKMIHTLASKFLSEARLSTHCKLRKPSNLEAVESFFSDAQDKPLMVEFVQNLGYAWEVSIQGLDPLHESRESNPAERTEDNVQDSGQAKQSQELYAAAHEDNSSLTSICEKTEAETTSIEENAKQLETGTKESKVVQEKTTEEAQATRATNRKACIYRRKHEEKRDVCLSDLPQKPEIQISVAENELSNISSNSCGWSGSNKHKRSVELPGSVGVDVVDLPSSKDDCSAPMAIPPEAPVDNEDEIRRLFLAPVQRDHEYSGFAVAVTTPSEFYIVLEDLLLIMNAVSNVLEDLPEDLAPLPEAHLVPGTGCLVKSEEKKKWCRAEIVQRISDDASVIVNLVDYGYCVHLACQDVCKLKTLPIALAGLSKITHPCLLRGIKPADDLQWSDHAIMFFQQCMYQNNLKIHFRQYVSEAQWEVDVVTSDRNVAKELVDAGHAHYIDNMLGIRFQQGLGHKREIKSNPVYEATSGKHEHKQSKMEEVPHRYLEDESSNDEEISEGCSTEGQTEDPFSGIPDKRASPQKTYGQKPTLSQCVSGLQ